MVWSKEAAKKLREAKWEYDAQGNRIPGCAPMLAVKTMEPFKSPVDGSIITSGSDLKKHNERNDVVDSREFSKEYFAGKAKERERKMDPASIENKKQRVEDIHKSIHKLQQQEN